MKKDIIIISNCCLGKMIQSSLLDREYNNPFIGTLIPEDSHFLKLCENILEYINYEPICDNLPSSTTNYSKQVNSIWYNNPAISIPYPIIHLNDIEIHCIHEKNINETLTKFKRRFERLKEIIEKNNYKIFMIMTWSNLFTIHNDNNYKLFINNFLSNNKNDDMIFIFLGPRQYISNHFYIDDDYFKLDIIRRPDNVNIQIDFTREHDIIINFIKNNFVI